MPGKCPHDITEPLDLLKWSSIQAWHSLGVLCTCTHPHVEDTVSVTHLAISLFFYISVDSASSL